MDEMEGQFAIIDAHCHLGRSAVTGVEIDEDGLLGTMRANGIGVAMTMPQPHQGLDVAPVHDRIARFAAAHPGMIHGMANLSPRLAEAGYRAEAERCVKGHGFRALKLDPAETVTFGSEAGWKARVLRDGE